ncbi:hypothetical protein GCM10023148_03030 [Actinokineospora soli]
MAKDVVEWFAWSVGAAGLGWGLGSVGQEVVDVHEHECGVVRGEGTCEVSGAFGDSVPSVGVCGGLGEHGGCG